MTTAGAARRALSRQALGAALSLCPDRNLARIQPDAPRPRLLTRTILLTRTTKDPEPCPTQSAGWQDQVRQAQAKFRTIKRKFAPGFFSADQSPPSSGEGDLLKFVPEVLALKFRLLRFRSKNRRTAVPRKNGDYAQGNNHDHCAGHDDCAAFIATCPQPRLLARSVLSGIARDFGVQSPFRAKLDPEEGVSRQKRPS